MAQDMDHKLTLNQRQRLTMTGVNEVISFDDTEVVLLTCMGELVIHGEGLQLKTLSVEGGQVAVDGTVNAMHYQAQRPAGGFLSRLFT